MVLSTIGVVVRHHPHPRCSLRASFIDLDLYLCACVLIRTAATVGEGLRARGGHV